MTESLRRTTQYSTCRHCEVRIFKTTQPRVGMPPLNSYWKHINTKNRRCIIVRNADPGHHPVTP